MRPSLLFRASLTVAAPPVVIASLLVAPAAAAETYQVGPDKPLKDLSAIESMLEPGDLVEVDGDATYPGNIHIRAESSGTAESKVTIRGVPVNGKRPKIEGGDEFSIVLNASHIVFENFEITGGEAYCLVHKADDVTVRNVQVHDCPNHGILGTDDDSGSALFEYVEVFHCGNGQSRHQIYMATDESTYPGSVFRLQHSYVHDGNGGNSVKSRSERNEIYYNWIEGEPGTYHLLDLIGPDGQDPGLAREDSDVVGNVLVQNGEWNISRFGGDGTGETGGRYRFAYNTIILGADAQGFRATDSVESAEISNNVFFMRDGGGPELFKDPEAAWTGGMRALAGANNLFSVALPASDDLDGSKIADPAFESLDDYRLSPAMGSPLVDAAADGLHAPDGLEIPSPQVAPAFVPPRRGIDAALSAAPRKMVGPPDIGAFELGSPTNPATSSSVGSGAGSSSGGDGGDGAEGCSCAVERSGSASAGLLAGLGLLTALARRRRSREP